MQSFIRYASSCLLLALALATLAFAAKEFVAPEVHPARTYPANEEHRDERVVVAIDPFDTSGKTDIFTVHYYPQGGEFSDDVSGAMQQRRNRSTRSLWDPAYVDETWINDRVQLVPRLKSWVNGHYPGTQTGITEYNWGAENHINGATAQADILGIFGREGLDVAARWATPASTTPTYKAIKMYRNYDGNRSAFGETSVAATAPNPDAVAAFAALRSSDGALTVMVISKSSSGSTPAVISMANFVAGGVARAWQLTAANTIARLPDVTVAGSALAVTLPPQSITLLVVPAGGQLTAPTRLRVVR